MPRHNPQQSGFALLLSIVVASVLLALGLTMLSITSKQLLLSSIARESEIAFQAALAGIECMTYHRRSDGVNVTDYFDQVTPGNATSRNCFDETPFETPTQSVYDSRDSGDDYTNHFEYRWSWGSNSRCTEIELFVMVADADGNGDGDYTSLDFSSVNEAIGDNGLKDCSAGDRCTVLVSRGFNKSCTDVDSGLATVQRELTSQF